MNKSLGAHASSVHVSPAGTLPAVREGSAFSEDFAPFFRGCAAVFALLQHLLEIVRAVYGAVTFARSHVHTLTLSAARWLASPRRPRQLVACALMAAVLTQANVPMVSALTYLTPAERARKAALASIDASIKANRILSERRSGKTRSPAAFIAKLPGLPSLPSLSPALAFASKVLYTILPFDEDGFRISGNRAQGAGDTLQGSLASLSNSARSPESFTGKGGGIGDRLQGTGYGEDGAISTGYPLATTPSSFRNLIAGLLHTGLFTPTAQSGAQLTDAVVSINHPTLNTGLIQGTMRVFQGQNFNYNGGMVQTGDLFVVGTPTINILSPSSSGGTVTDGGSSTPTGYTITLQGGAKVEGKIHIHADPVPLPSGIPTSVPSPSGTRTVNINSPSDVSQIGDWSTVRNLNVNPSGLAFNVPPGNYGQFTLNNGGTFNFGPGTYNFANSITLNSNATINATGPVVINVAQDLNINQGFIKLGPSTGPADVILNALSGSMNLNGSTSISAMVRAANATVNLNGTSSIRGQLICKSFSINGGQVVADQTSGQTGIPVVSISTPANNTTVFTNSISVTGTASDTGTNPTGITQVLVNNVAASYT
ncbi:MAG: hypothetical protein ACREDR_21665, partial [Blastocatellia bacterium]